MKAEFNADGSIRLPCQLIKDNKDDESFFRDEACLRIITDQVSTTTPLMCCLKLQASERLEKPDRIRRLFHKARGRFKHLAKLSIEKTDEKEYCVLIISGRYRCDWCNDFREFLKKELNVPIIDCGGCFTYKSSR